MFWARWLFNIVTPCVKWYYKMVLVSEVLRVHEHSIKSEYWYRYGASPIYVCSMNRCCVSGASGCMELHWGSASC